MPSNFSLGKTIHMFWHRPLEEVLSTFESGKGTQVREGLRLRLKLRA